MAVIVIDENTKEGRVLIDSLRNKSYAQIIEEGEQFPNIMSEPAVAYGKATTIAYPNDEDMLFERIPGLPYTHEERMESLRRAEEDIAAGRTLSWDDFKKEMAQW